LEFILIQVNSFIHRIYESILDEYEYKLILLKLYPKINNFLSLDEITETANVLESKNFKEQFQDNFKTNSIFHSIRINSHLIIRQMENIKNDLHIN